MFWFREKSGLYPYSEEWDKALNDALDKWPITDIGDYTCKIGPYKVWLGNFPYAYGRLYSPNLERIPKRSTRQRLFQAIVAAAIEQAQDSWIEPVAPRIRAGIKP